MKIKRYSIPKLPRSKYASVSSSYSNGGAGNNIINNYNDNTKVEDNLTSDSTNSALSANMGKVLNDTKLSKKEDDTAEGKITFNKGLSSIGDIRAGGFNDNGDTNKGGAFYSNENKWNAIADNVTARDNMVTPEIGSYNSDDTKGWYVKKEGEQYTLKIDNAIIKHKMEVQTLEVEEAKYIGNDLFCTQAGFVCNAVDSDFILSYRIYFNNKDENDVTIPNKFQVNDLAYCHIYDGGRVKEWWRKVIGVGENYIDVSKRDCLAGSSEPEVGDNVVQFGNTEDETRQSALVIWTDGICMYKGINTYVVPSPSAEFTSAGNIKIEGEIKAKTGNIGRFDINNDGLFNDVDADGVGQIEMIDRANGIGFRVGSDKKYLTNTCAISNSNGTALNCTSQNNTGIVAKGGRDGYGIDVSGGARIKGLILNINTIGSSTPTKSVNFKFDDIIFIPENSDRGLQISLPTPTATFAGKLFYFYNLSRYDVKLTNKACYGNNGYITVPSGCTSIVLTDGIKWFEFKAVQ